MEEIIEEGKIQKLINEISGEKIVLVGGCFDIVHLGHLKFLEEAKKRGKKLIVLLESDENIKKIKGNNRPVNNQENRAYFLSKLKTVDYTIKLSGIKSDEDYDELVRIIRPKVIAISEGDKNIDKKVDQAKQVDAELVTVVKLIPQQSSSQIIKTILNKK
jgi:FAD synthetase